jgi:hypothetical protein
MMGGEMISRRWLAHLVWTRTCTPRFHDLTLAANRNHDAHGDSSSSRSVLKTTGVPPGPMKSKSTR